MAGHYWVMSGLTVAAAVTMGLGLGTYATSPQQPRQVDQQEAESNDYAMSSAGSGSDMAADAGPVAIRCSGCGPSLAERRFAADRAAYDSYSVDSGRGDPMVQDYLAQDDAPLVLPEPTPVQRPPADIQRIDMGTAAPPLVPTQVGTIAPAVPTEAGEGDRS